jgi:uncharacterized protein (DUF2384 family)
VLPQVRGQWRIAGHVSGLVLISVGTVVACHLAGGQFSPHSAATAALPVASALRCGSTLDGIDWGMARIERAPSGLTVDSPELRGALLELISKSLAMGLLASDGATDLTRATLENLLDALRTHGLGEHPEVDLAPRLTRGADRLGSAVAGAVTQKVRELNEALSRLPAPATEWSSMRQMLGDDALVDLAGISRTSLRRYSNEERATPQAVAERLHWLAMVTADLAGSYNEFGIRRWFERPRAQLNGSSPRKVLNGNWKPSSAEAHRIKQLSAALV